MWWAVGAASLSAGLAYAFVPRGWRPRRVRSGGREPASRSVARVPRRAGGRIIVTIEKALDVRAPLRAIFAQWARVESLPQIMPHLRDIREVALDRHRWVMAEPSAEPIEWETVITRFGTNQVMAWETPPGSLVRHSGRMTFRGNADGSTRVSIWLSYVLPPGEFGERVVALLRADEFDEALRRWKASTERS